VRQFFTQVVRLDDRAVSLPIDSRRASSMLEAACDAAINECSSNGELAMVNVSTAKRTKQFRVKVEFEAKAIAREVRA
jgi:hypothetical protein